MSSYDLCIVGAGVVGCAIARELAHRPRARSIRIIVLESREGAGEETSSRNSGVLHSGIHEDPDSLKGRLAREGSELAVAYAVRRRIPLLPTGMIIAVSWEDVRGGLWRETSSLWRLWRNARRANIRTKFLIPSGLRRWEPNLRAAFGIAIPSVAVIDSSAFVRSLQADAESAGVRFAFDNRVTHIEPNSDAYRIATSRQELRASCLINAAGLHADEVASMVLPSARYALAPLRGEYYEITTEPTKRLIGRLVYPALPAGTVGKGIHFSPRPNGRMFLGPNTVPVESKTDYTSNRTPPHAFLHAVKKFLPVIEERDLRWAYSGIRPRLRAAHGGQEDFVISADVDDPLLINLVGIDSPGLSAALGIARYVAEMPCLQRRFHS